MLHTFFKVCLVLSCKLLSNIRLSFLRDYSDEDFGRQTFVGSKTRFQNIFHAPLVSNVIRVSHDARSHIFRRSQRLTVLSTSRTLPLDPAALPNIQFYHALRMINKLSPNSWISQLGCVDINCYLHIQFDKRPDNCGQYLVSPLIQNSTHQITMSHKGQANYICRMQSVFCSRAINDFIKNITKVSEVKVSLKHSLNFIQKNW